MELLIKAFRKQVSYEIYNGIVAKISSCLIVYTIVSYATSIYALRFETEIKRNYAKPYKIDQPILTILICAFIAVNIVHICMQLSQRSRIEKELRTDYAELCKEYILYYIPTLLCTPGLCYCDKGILVLKGFTCQFIPLESIVYSELCDRPHEPIELKHSIRISINATLEHFLVIKYRDAQNNISETNFHFDECTLHKPELAELALLLKIDKLLY